MRALPFFLLLVHLFAGCNPGGGNIPAGPDSTTRFLPVTAFIESELKGLDSLQVNPMHLITVNGRTDSFWLQTPGEARKILHPFTEHPISDTNLCRYFHETKFNDLSVNAVTFTYQPKENTQAGSPIRNWNVYVNNATGKMQRIYLVKRFNADGKETEQQLTWVSDKWAKITTLAGDGAGPLRLVREEKVVWNFND